ncbi:MAG: tetratricopeptide repeat protein [candidate division NC10 bacterium]|nr:tetratricopeptide repeat protein [candidate division NC10 bacterium]
MASKVNSEKTTREKPSIDRVHLYLFLSAALAIGFLLGYLASAVVPLVRPSPSTAPSTSTAPAARLTPSEVDAALKTAHTALDAGDIQAAWDKYHQILMTDPHQVEALTHLGNILMRENKVDEAIRLYDRALALNANYKHALFDKGQALKDKGDAKGATEVWKRFLALVPADSDDAKKVKGSIAELEQAGRSALKKEEVKGK